MQRPKKAIHGKHPLQRLGRGLARTLVVGVLAYVFLVGCLRWSGKRTLSKMNAFDLIVTVSLGSVLASLLLSNSVALAEGVVALSLLICLQFVVTWTSVRVRWVRRVVTGEPLMLLEQGEFLPAALQHARVTEDEVCAAVRAAGIGPLARVAAVVLETDGSFSVIKQESNGENGNDSADKAHLSRSSLSDVRRLSDDRHEVS